MNNREHNQAKLDNEFSRPYQYVQTLNSFRKIKNRKPLPQVLRVDKVFWEALIETRGQKYADEFEAWICS